MVFPSLTLHHCPFATIVVFQDIGSLLNKHLSARTRWVGSLGSNFICVSTQLETFWGVLPTSATTDDRQVVPELTTQLFGKLYADKGYISQKLRASLQSQDIDLIYKVRKNMKPIPLSDFDAMMLKKRMLIESVIKEIKTQTQLQHTRHRSFVNFQVNMFAALIAYTYLEKKPSLNLQQRKNIKNVSHALKN